MISPHKIVGVVQDALARKMNTLVRVSTAPDCGYTVASMARHLVASDDDNLERNIAGGDGAALQELVFTLTVTCRCIFFSV